MPRPPIASDPIEMTLRCLPTLLLPLGFISVSAAVDEIKSAVTAAAALTNSSGGNTTQSGGTSPAGLFTGLGVDSSMIQRALYVLIGFTMIGLLYFLIRAVRLKKPMQRKKYGLLLNDSVEMEAVESDEDDTLFEARSLNR